ncbi:hypothetical protein ACR9GP_19905, partial [Enterobacter ludwigii]
VSSIDDKLTGAAKDAAREVNKLTKQQEKLKQRINEAGLAGKDVSKLNAKYEELSDSINTASRRLSRFNALGQTATSIGNAWRGTAFLGRGAMAVARPAMLGAGLGAGVVGGALALNAQTAETFGQAKTYGLDISTYKAMGSIAKMAGLNAENFGDLVEEMKNKIGEVGNEKMMNELLPQIGLNKAQLLKATKADPQKAFADVMQRLTQGVKEGKISAVQAQSFADQLFGGEGNKLVTIMNELGMTYQEELKNRQKYNLLTEKGARDGMQGQQALNNLWDVASSGMGEVVSRITGEIAPDINKTAQDLAVWAKNVTPDVTKVVTEWIKPDETGKGGLERAWGSVVRFGDAVGTVASVIASIASKLNPEIDENTVGGARTRAGVEADKELAQLQTEGKLKFGESAAYKKRKMDEAEKLFRLQNIAIPLAESSTRVTGVPFPVPAGDEAAAYTPVPLPLPKLVMQPVTTNNSTTNNSTTNNVAPVINIYPQPGQTGDMVRDELSRLFPISGAPTYDGF